jgi:hypothetical protein
VAINFTKLKIILFLNRYLKKFEPVEIELLYFLRKKLFPKVSEIWFEDPGSGKTYLGSGIRGLKKRI